MKQESFYSYQQRRLRRLLFWGLASTVAGGLLLPWRSAFWRQFALQAMLWGAIDAALAFFGRRSAVRKTEQYMQGKLDSITEQRDARNFRRVLLINAGLDVGYVAVGLWLLTFFSRRPDLQGAGLGVLVQGIWLLLFDSLLARDVQQRGFLTRGR